MSFICFDTEDNSKELLAAGKSGFEKRVTQIAALTSTGERFHSPGNIEDFKTWLRDRPEDRIFAHNLQYDLGALFADQLDELDQILVGGRLVRARWKGKTFLDTYNLWPMSAANLGGAFGLAKLEFDAYSQAYIFRDVEIIQRAMLFVEEFCAQYGIKVIPATLGGLCVKFWKVLGGVNVHNADEISREAFYGGRVELFKKVNDSGHVGYTDINSLYPAMMKKKFPGLVAPVKEWPKFGVARVTVKLPKTDLGLLPWRDDESRILYPYGKINGTWTIAELDNAKLHGAKILTIHEMLGTDESFSPYSHFVDVLYDLRMKSKNCAEQLFFKLLMNNLFGRIGAGGVVSRTVWQTEENCKDGQPFGGKVLVDYQMPLAEETNWLHAAYVTAYGRIELFSYLKKIGAKRMIYCDTDSTIFDAPGQKLPFAVSARLGEMKLESWETSCETYAPKMYRVTEKYKAKGVPQRLAKDFCLKGHASFDLPFKMREAIRFYDRENSHKLSVWRKVTKQIRQDYNKKLRKQNRYFPRQITQNEISF